MNDNEDHELTTDETARHSGSSARPVGNRRRVRGDSGSSTVEFVLVMPALLLFVMAAVHLGLWFHSHQVAASAATAGARAARAQHAVDSDGTQAADQALDRDGPTMVQDRQITVTRTPTDVTVTVTGHSPMVVPGINQVVSVSITAPIERFT